MLYVKSKKPFCSKKQGDNGTNGKLTPEVTVCQVADTSVNHQLGSKYNAPPACMNNLRSDNADVYFKFKSPTPPHEVQGLLNNSYDAKQSGAYIRPREHSSVPFICSFECDTTTPTSTNPRHQTHDQVYPIFYFTQITMMLLIIYNLYGLVLRVSMIPLRLY